MCTTATGAGRMPFQLPYIIGEGELADARQVASGLAQRQGPQDSLAETGVGLRAGPLGLRLRRAHLADLLGAGGGLQPGPVSQAGGVDLRQHLSA